MSSESEQRSLLARRLTVALATPVILLVALGVVLGLQILQMAADSVWVDHTDQVLATAADTMQQIVDQETGARGFLITGDRTYLEPFERAKPDDGFARLHDLTADNRPQQSQFDEARQRYEAWLRLVTPTIAQSDVVKARDMEAMRARKQSMDRLRDSMREATHGEEVLRRDRVAASVASTQSTKRLFVILFAAAAAVLAFMSRRQLSSIATTFRTALQDEKRARETMETEAWIRAGQAKVGDALQGERSLHQLGEHMLAVLTSYTGAEIGAFFTKEGDGWTRRAGYALDSRAAGPETFAAGEGLIGQAAVDGKLLHLTTVPAEAPKVRAGTHESLPNALIVIPARIDGHSNAVIELGFVRAPDARSIEMLGRISESVALAVRSSEYKEQLRALLEEAQRQAEELQAQQEELRVSNEELEAQTTTLKLTQRQLETQQAELEQTNDQLVQQSKLLERQNEQLATTQADISAKAREVERASQFKSEFLSNMSHELRTPLNSSLILAKLLSENNEGNLTAEQVKFADTIYSAGNDLLTLINDILDLSKIEAGKMEIHPAMTPMDRLRGALLRTFEPVAKQKGIRFAVNVAPGTPTAFETDAQRAEQVLNNLVSNALKFTERGEVVVDIRGGDRITFAVRDTGIGIPDAQQTVIFEAFRQADGTTNRKYGGTGLGLSISRELARLLGGDIAVASEAGRGSTFTFALPPVFSGPAPAAKSPEVAAAAARVSTPPPRPSSPAPGLYAPASAAAPNDEAEAKLDPQRRTLLVIEDDAPFASIVSDVARDAGFQCLIATTAEQGFHLARKHVPIGIVLDMKLPDHSGLSVLDRLKRDPVTRHVPVHIISGSDFASAAMAMGAAAYLLKPVKREQLVQALRTLEERSASRIRHVLVVEDDAALRENVARLLGRADVEISTAATVESALALLREKTFDCIVTDLSLPDQSGFELLETMASEAPYSVPPVIVYTGRALTSDEEQRLRKYSQSIIVKGARSPERLLDEVTLFLHQVETELPPAQQKLLKQARHREALFEDRKILVVEDDVRNIFALTSVLEPRGARVVIARNGKEALDMLDKEKAIDLVLMDIMMPEMDGIACTKAIRQNPHWNRIPIIALTAKAMKDDQERCLAAGANDYLAKPLDIEMLLSLLRVWMPKN